MKTTPTRTVAALLALLVCLGSLCALSGCADTGTPENSTEDKPSVQKCIYKISKNFRVRK